MSSVAEVIEILSNEAKETKVVSDKEKDFNKEHQNLT